MSHLIDKWKMLVLAVAFPGLSSSAFADISAYAIWGRQGVHIGQSANVISGLTGSNGPVDSGDFVNYRGGLMGGGDLTYTGNGEYNVYGPTTFNGNASFGIYNTFAGPINSGGNVSFSGSPTVTGDISAAGSVTIGGAGTLHGNIKAGGDAIIGGVFTIQTGNVSANQLLTVNGTVNGNVTYGGVLAVGTFGAISGSRSRATMPVLPIAYMPQTLPAADVFSSGGANVTAGGSAAAPLAPGSYGSLAFSGFSDLYLGPGNYYFSNLNFSGLTSLHFVNLGGASKIHIFSTGDVTGTLHFPTVNGVKFAQADPSLGANVLLETLGNFTMSSDFYGSIFAPNGSITTGSYATIDGSLIAGNLVTAAVGTTVNYAAPLETAYIVPEPASLSLVAIAIPILVRRRRAR